MKSILYLSSFLACLPLSHAQTTRLSTDFTASDIEKSVTWNFDSPTTPETPSSNDTGLTIGNFTFTAPAGADFITVLPDASGDGTTGTLGSNTRAAVASRNDSDIATNGAQAMSFNLTIGSAQSFDFNSLSFEHGFNERGNNSLTPVFTLTIHDGISELYRTSGNLPQHNSGTDLFYSQDVTLDLSSETNLQNISNKTLTVKWEFSNLEGRSNSIAQRAHTIDDLTLKGKTSTLSTPQIHLFTADDTLIDPGQTVALSWNVSDADQLTINPGNIDVTSDPDQQIEFVINESTTYTLTATNADGSSSAELPVYLNPTVPNVLLVLVDDMGTEDTSVDFNYDSAGNKVDRVDPTSVGLAAFATDNRHFRTPNMETLAAQGMKFSRAYACQVCSPTRVSLLTGQNSARHGTIQYIGGGGNLHNLKAPQNPGLKDANLTLAEIMRDAGYRTIISGKGHIGNVFNSNANNYSSPANPADDYYGFQVNVSASNKGSHGSCYSNASNAFGLPASGTTASLVAEYQDKTYNQIDPENYPANHPQANEPIFVTEAITRELNERIEDSVNQGKPFFAYLSQFAVHDPHQPDPRFTANYPNLSGDVLDFATMVEGIDQSLGDVITKLEELEVAENTLVIFLGDNGSDSKPRGPNNPSTLTMTNPLRGEKGMRYEGGIRVPLIISWAKTNATNPHQQSLPILIGGRENDIVSVEDLFPTILATCGIPLPTTDDNQAPLIIDGTDLSPYLRGQPGSHRPQKLITHAPCSSRSSFFTTYHQDNWKLIYNYTTSSPVTSTNVPLGTYELYDLANDIHEANNLAATQPEVVMNMARAMARELERLGAPYPILKAYDADLDALGLPSAANDTHPVILPPAASVDSDNDGLSDNAEDPNRNGLVDPGETDPLNEDSDHDATPDGVEEKIGTSPLDASSSFQINSQHLQDGSLLLSWPSSPGNTFSVQTSSDLTDWTAAPLSTITAPSNQSFTQIQLSPPITPTQFFRIELLNNNL
ncbi:sulfatase-like hydrolase/transferase [Rubritalea tangerina]|uniref:Sulfatase-like hydrolase/transferase n=1 Tax=Rubritalea tangerina TaxID=430798 RepID=A0ABW4ZAD3_9BACT